MYKNLEKYAVIALLILGLFFAVGLAIKYNNHNRELKRNLSELNAKYEALLNAPKDTIILKDTLKVEKPKIEYRYIDYSDTITIRDTIKQTVIYQLPRERMVYRDSSYRAVVSGVLPQLDSIEIYNQTKVITKHLTEYKVKRWGVGLGLGASYDGKKIKPAITVGVQYNLIAF